MQKQKSHKLGKNMSQKFTTQRHKRDVLPAYCIVIAISAVVVAAAAVVVVDIAIGVFALFTLQKKLINNHLKRLESANQVSSINLE